MECPKCRQEQDIDKQYKFRELAYDFENNKILYIPYFSCQGCDCNLFLHPKDKVLRLMSEYTCRLNNIGMSLQTKEERQEYYRKVVCNYSKERINYYFDIHILYDDRKEPRHEPIIMNRNNLHKIKRCSWCSVNEFWKEPLLEYYNEDNKKAYACVNHRTNCREFFGFNFRKLKGRTSKINPYDRLVGVEIECVNGEHTNYFSLPEQLQSNVGCMYDGSLYGSNLFGEEDDDNSPVNSDQYYQDDDHEARGNGKEFVTIPLGRDTFVNTIVDLCKFLRDTDHDINKSCGLHLHFDMTDEDDKTHKKTFVLFSLMENVLRDMLPPSRRNNYYCKTLYKHYRSLLENKFDSYWYGTNDSFEKQRQKRHKYNESRYVSINYHSLFRHHTLENRLHSGTLNPKKIINWMLINQILIEYAINTPMNKLLSLAGDKNTLFRIVRLAEKEHPELRQHNLIQYMETRMRKFAVPDKKPIRPISQLRDSKMIDSMKGKKALREMFSDDVSPPSNEKPNKINVSGLTPEDFEEWFNNNTYSQTYTRE